MQKFFLFMVVGFMLGATALHLQCSECQIANASEQESKRAVALTGWRKRMCKRADMLAANFGVVGSKLDSYQKKFASRLSSLREARGITGLGSVASVPPTKKEMIYNTFFQMLESQRSQIQQFQEFWTGLNLSWAEE